MKSLVRFVLVALAGCAADQPPLPPPPMPPPPVSTPPGPAQADEAVPALRLPADTHPVAEAVELHIDPKQQAYTGSVDIDIQLDAPRSTVWLHGKGQHVTRATVTPDGAGAIDATWTEKHDSGVVAVALAKPAPAGKARIHVEFDAPFGRGGHGLYKAREADVDYAFTQFEAIAARQAFPCFDEPGFKIPFTTTLVVPEGTIAVANTREVSHAPDAGGVRYAFAPTLPLPSYLVAFAVGPFDIVPAPDVPANGVRTRALPMRAVTARGRGKEIAYALAHTGEILATLEKYTGLEYPYDKLDIVAVPGKGGAMENPGCVTFGEPLLLMDEATAPVSQKRGYARVMAHELAHQWTGDLVTHAWWDDIWLNEAFASWLGPKAADLWQPSTHSAMSLVRGAQGAMSVDALVSARAIRQPIQSTHDIENAFDSITYQKGGAVLAMFERWAGADAWQKGLHAYLAAHRFGSATADDFLQAENDATGKDVKTAFHTFLDQPGVPLVDVRVDCATPLPPHSKPDHQPPSTIHLAQSRFLPLGSTGDSNATWQIPVCLRTDAGETCTLLTDREASVQVPSCPQWVLPNADAAGYYRFALAKKDLEALRTKGLPKLTEREKVAYATSLRAAWSRASTPMKDILAAEEPLARDAEPAVAEEPMGYVSTARDWLFADPLRAKVEGYARTLYTPVARKLGWDIQKNEDDEARSLRASALSFLANTGRDPAVRAEAKKRGLAYLGIGKDGAVHPEAVDANLAGIAVTVVGEDADKPTWDAMRALLGKTVDEAVRGRLVRGLSVARDPALAAAAREMVLDPSLRDTETMTPLYMQIDRPETRDVAWAWLKDHYDAILTRLPRHHAGVQLIGAGRAYCDEEHARDIESFFGPKADGIEGGPRALRSLLEDVRLCSARRGAHLASAKEFFGKR